MKTITDRAFNPQGYPGTTPTRPLAPHALRYPAALALVVFSTVTPNPVWATEGPVPALAPDAVIDAGGEHTCAVLGDGTVRCWGVGESGQLGYGNTDDIGDNETPLAAGPVAFGGPTAIEVTAGGAHSCAILSDGGVRCWGSNYYGQLGYSDIVDVGDDETLAAIDNVYLGVDHLGVDRTAVAISAGEFHTCAILDNGQVSCWGWGASGRLGYGNEDDIGDTEDPADAGYVELGNGRTAKEIAAGGAHTCVILDNDQVRCWGDGSSGQLGYGNTDDVGDTEDPGDVGPVDLGSGGLRAKSLATGDKHTCVILSNHKIRCWGHGSDGALGYGNPDAIGDTEVPNTATVGHVDVGGIDALKLSAGKQHTCAILADRTTRCWGNGTSANGLLGNPAIDGITIGDDETPTSVDPIDLGYPASRAAPVAITAGEKHNCSVFLDGSVLCWGFGEDGALGRSNTQDLGDYETLEGKSAIPLGGPVLGASPPPLWP